MSKRGQGLSTGAIVLIILGVIVLAILAFGFSLGWNKLLPFLSTNNNVNTISTQCALSCTQGDKFGFCTSARNITANGNVYEGTCADFASNPGNVRLFDGKQKGGTLGGASASDLQSFAIAKCSSITC